MVCDDPTLERHVRTNRKGVEKVHVQFFENPPSRSWTPKRFSYMLLFLLNFQLTNLV